MLAGYFALLIVVSLFLFNRPKLQNFCKATRAVRNSISATKRFAKNASQDTDCKQKLQLSKKPIRGASSLKLLSFMLMIGLAVSIMEVVHAIPGLGAFLGAALFVPLIFILNFTLFAHAYMTLTGELHFIFKVFIFSTLVLYSATLLMLFWENMAASRAIETLSIVLGFIAIAVIFLGLPVVITIMFIKNLRMINSGQDRAWLIVMYVIPIVGSLCVIIFKYFEGRGK